MTKRTILVRGVIVPLGVFVLSLLVVVAIDRYLRLSNGDIRTGGLPETVWFAAHVACVLVPFGLLLPVVRRVESKWAKLSLIGSDLLIGWLVYIVIVFSYITGSGIDSL